MIGVGNQPGAGTSSACGRPLASSIDAKSQPRAGCAFCWSVSTVRVKLVAPPGPRVGKLPLDTEGLKGLIEAEPVTSVKPPGLNDRTTTPYGMPSFFTVPTPSDH